MFLPSAVVKAGRLRFHGPTSEARSGMGEREGCGRGRWNGGGDDEEGRETRGPK